MLNRENIISLRMQRQHLVNPADVNEYKQLYKDVSPVQNIHWCGFGQPPSMTFRTSFDDVEYNRQRQADRELIKGRFAGGNIGFIEEEELELFIALYKKTYKPSEIQEILLRLIDVEGPMNIQVMKEMTGFLVKEITPALHKLQESFLIYEDQYDGDWDRAWYRFEEMFPEVNQDKYTKQEALKITLKRFAYRYVHFNIKEANSFYRIPAKEIKAAVMELVAENVLTTYEDGYLLTSDYHLLSEETFSIGKFILALHRNDFLVKCNEYWLKEKYKSKEVDVLQYLLIDGELKGAVMGNFRYGPYDLEDVILDLTSNECKEREAEIISAIHQVNDRDTPNPIKRFGGVELE